MAMVMDSQQQQVTVAQMQPPPSPPQPEAYKHYCRVCKKGFMCGRALGGHMRAHDISDDGLGANVDALDDDSALYGGEGDPWDVGSPTAGTKSMYALRANLNRLKSCRVCENCGKEFVSWKLFLEHGKCSSSDEEDDVDGSLHSPRPYEVDGEEDAALVAGWSKGRRSRRSKVMVLGSVPLSASPLHCSSSEEEDLANCLVMLSASRVEQVSIVETDQESCASASKEEARRPPMPQPISFMAPAPQKTKVVAAVVPQNVSATPRGMFECKACKKVFPSHQALGGHRASHKKVKGCFAAKLESNLHEPLLQMPTAPGDIAKAAPNVNANVGADAKTDANANADSKMDVDTTEAAAATAALAMAIVPFHDQSAALTISPFKKKAKLHECSICHRVFTSGQALGGHKRCHWLTSSTADPNGPMTKIQSQAQEQADAIFHQLTLRSMLVDAPEPTLDLNIPANPSPDIAAARRAELGGSPLRLDVPASVYHQSWPAAHSNASHRNKAATSSHNDVGGSAAEDESDSTSVKRAKLSDLKDMNMVGESSPWLQVGIGSSSGSDEKGTQE